jgi:hypothetical protein
MTHGALPRGTRADASLPVPQMYSFDVVTPSGVLTLCANTESDRRNWVRLLYQAILAVLQVPPSLAMGVSAG